MSHDVQIPGTPTHLLSRHSFNGYCLNITTMEFIESTFHSWSGDGVPLPVRVVKYEVGELRMGRSTLTGMRESEVERQMLVSLPLTSMAMWESELLTERHENVFKGMTFLFSRWWYRACPDVLPLTPCNSSLEWTVQNCFCSLKPSPHRQEETSERQIEERRDPSFLAPRENFLVFDSSLTSLGLWERRDTDHHIPSHTITSLPIKLKHRIIIVFSLGRMCVSMSSL